MLNISRFDQVTRFDLARTLAGHGRYWTTAYLVDGLLVDTGCAHTAPELQHALKDASLHRIVNTHTHEDHIGADGLLQRQRQVLEILAHPLALPILADPRGKQPLQPYRRLFWGWPEPARGTPVSDKEFIETPNHRFQVIYTPGHSLDHICFYEPDQGWLFSGDLFVGGQDRALGARYDIWQIIASLKRVADLPLKALFPGSARVRKDPGEEIKSKISYLEDLGGRILNLHDQGRDVRAITRLICGAPMPVELITLGHFSRRHLVLSYLGMNQD